MDLIILLIICVAIVFWKRSVKFFIYFIGITEIFFRTIHFISNNIKLKDFSNFVSKYIPSSILDIFSKYSSGLLFDIISWGFVACFILLEIYLIKLFLKKK